MEEDGPIVSRAQMENGGKNILDKRAPNVFERAKEEIEAIAHQVGHYRESHGRDERVNEDTPLNEVKAPNLFDRAKEEIEAVVQHIHEKKESHQDFREEHEGFWVCVAKRLERFCGSHRNTQNSS